MSRNKDSLFFLYLHFLLMEKIDQKKTTTYNLIWIPVLYFLQFEITSTHKRKIQQ